MTWAIRTEAVDQKIHRLFVLACMDERLPVEEALGIESGDAHIFRNAGGLVTDHVIYSVMLTTNFFGTEEIVIISHTECGMMSAHTDTLVKALSDKVGNSAAIALDPALPELKLTDSNTFGRWIKISEDVDEISESQVALLRDHPLIPKSRKACLDRIVLSL